MRSHLAIGLKHHTTRESYLRILILPSYTLTSTSMLTASKKKGLEIEVFPQRLFKPAGIRSLRISLPNQE